MITRIEIPPALRDDIQNFLENLKVNRQLAPSLGNELRAEISGLVDLKNQLTAEIERLRPYVVASEDAAGKMYTKEVRLREVDAKINELRDKLARLKPATLIGASELIELIVRHYHEHLPPLIRQMVKFISPGRDESTLVVKTCAANEVLSRLRFWQWEINRASVDSNQALELQRVFERVLRGQPHLGLDFEEYKTGEATAPVQTPAQRETVQTTETHTASTEPAPAMKTQEAALT